jgi:hypothetical protein
VTPPKKREIVMMKHANKSTILSSKAKEETIELLNKDLSFSSNYSSDSYEIDGGNSRHSGLYQQPLVAIDRRK